MFEWPVRVYWEDTDAGGIVFYANYLKYFERSRTEWLRQLGLNQQRLRDDTGGMFVVSHAAVDYAKPARLDDELVISTQLQQLGRASLHLHQTAKRGNTLLCQGLIVVGWVDCQTLRPMRMPLPVLEALRVT
jgi:acyl-CoA thioester hydrolase